MPSIHLIVSSLIVVALVGPCFASIDSETEEIGYDELVRRLSHKAQKVTPAPNTFDPDLDNLAIHASFGLLTSVNSVSSGNDTGLSSNDVKPQNGFQLGLGINLFSPQFIAMGVLRNLGQITTGTETRSIREFDLSVVFKQPSYHFTAGLGTRYLRLTDPAQKLNVDDTTPISVLATGIDAPLTNVLNLSLELGWRSAIVNSTSDKSSLDLTVGLDATF